jgi:hypothetical protein
MSLTEEILAVFNDTNQPQLSGFCNLTFQSFLMVNYEEVAIKEDFPNLYKLYYGEDNGQSNQVG